MRILLFLIAFLVSPAAAVTPTPTRSSVKKVRPTVTTAKTLKSKPTPTPTVKAKQNAHPKPQRVVKKAMAQHHANRKSKKAKSLRFQFTGGGGLSFPDSDRFDSKGGITARCGVEVFAWRYWTLGLRGQVDQFEWLAPDASDPTAPDSYRLTRVYGGSAVSRILLKSSGTKPYILGGVGVFTTEARETDSTSIYPHKGPFYPIAFGMEFELNPKWFLGIEYNLFFLEDRRSHHVTQVSNLVLSTGFGID